MASPSFYLRLTVEICIVLYALFLYTLSRNPTAHLLSNASSFADLKQALDVLQTRAQGSQADNLMHLRQELQQLETASQRVCEVCKPAPVVAPVVCPAVSKQQQNTDSDFYPLAMAGSSCYEQRETENWGDPVVWGSQHHTPTAAECCAACQAHKAAAARGGLDKGVNSTSCNVWVHCGDKATCGEHYLECWLKHQTLPKLPAKPAGQHREGLGWIAGSIPDPEEEVTALATKSTLGLLTRLGTISVQLLPDLAPASTRNLRRMASMLLGGHCNGCHFYRSEKNFLIQGIIMSPGFYVAVPRHPSPKQKTMMERGLVCWAGGFGGPDFFINLVDNGGFGDSHLCWGKIDNMTLVDAIVQLPLKPKANPNDMTFIADPVLFNITLQ